MKNKMKCVHILCDNSLFVDLIYSKLNNMIFADEIIFKIYNDKFKNIINIENDVAIFIDINESYEQLFNLKTNECIKEIPWIVLTGEKKSEALSILNGYNNNISFCPIDISLDELVNIIFLVCRRRKVFLDRFCLSNIANHQLLPPADLRADQLRILGYLSEGLPNKVIARREGCDESVVKFKVRSLIVKLGVSNRTQAAVKAVAMGLAPSAADVPPAIDAPESKSVYKRG